MDNQISLSEWALHFVVCESLRGWFKAMQVRYGSSTLGWRNCVATTSG